MTPVQRRVLTILRERGADSTRLTTEGVVSGMSGGQVAWYLYRAVNLAETERFRASARRAGARARGVGAVLKRLHDAGLVDRDWPDYIWSPSYLINQAGVEALAEAEKATEAKRKPTTTHSDTSPAVDWTPTAVADSPSAVG